MIARPPAAAPRPYRFPNFSRQRLDNGLSVWLVPLPERELVSVHLLTDAGAAAEDEPQAGIAALTAQLLVTGTQRLDAAAFAETTERLGIEVSSESSWDSARAGFVALGEHLEAGLALLAEMIRTPRLDDGEFDRLRAERLNDILQARADPGRLADEGFIRELYAEGVPYGRVSAGSPETVGSLTVDDARAFHAGRYAPDRAHLILAGALDEAAALTSIERQLGDWHGAATGHRTIEPRTRGGRRVVLVDRPGSVQSELRVGHLGIDRHDPRLFPATVMAALLGGVFGSRLNLKLREELGYTYGARCSFDPRRAAGPFTTTAAVQTEVTADAIRELLGQLDRMRNEAPGEAELAEVRDFLIGVFPLRFETTAGVAGAIEPLAVYGLPDDYWQTYRERIEAVDIAAVQSVARDLVRPDEALILLTGDASRVRNELERAAFGPLEVIPAP
ncbi:MAG: pitrilysin family protein [Chloroflexota bacterium]